MSLVIKLEDDLGERSEWVLLHGVIPARDERDFPLLRCVDAYGKTVFNHLQMENFLDEWSGSATGRATKLSAMPGRKSKTWPEPASRTVISTFAL